jgi:NAD(P)H-dependent flavin oxidoreductase YrpB (nitropropane dioxygenase family)
MHEPPKHPVIIQGGMGVGVSGWRLAQAVARLGHLGVVSGTALAHVFVSRLRQGDAGGHLRRALAHFPDPAIAERVLLHERSAIPMYTIDGGRELLELTVVASFVEVFLAKEGHGGPVGINLLEKIQLPTLPTLYGAMLAGVDYVLMGAGIPREIPAVLDRLALHEDAALKLSVEDAAPHEDHRVHFRPRDLLGPHAPPLRRPFFLAIVASDVLATTLARKSQGRVDGFVVEGPVAGGHNAPPRGALTLNERGEPIYGPRDAVDLAKLRALELPFWLAGAYGTAERLHEARAAGAHGVQVGTAFAFCRESGFPDETKRLLLERSRRGEGVVLTSAVASPTGFPFKVVAWEGSLSDEAVYRARPRVCNLGYLRRPYRRADGTLGYRCPGEPEELYARKGGKESTAGRICLCNGLLAAVGLPQGSRSDAVEPPVITSGDDFTQLARLLGGGRTMYSAADVIASLLPAGG